MGLLNKLFGGREPSSRIDLTQPFRDLLVNQSDPIVRGVIIHAISSMEKLQTPDDATRTLLGKRYIKQTNQELVNVQKQQNTRTATEIALDAIDLSVGHIFRKAGTEILVGNGMVIKDLSGTEIIKKAAILYAFGLFVESALILQFINAKALSAEDEKVKSGEWQLALLNNHFILASPEQRAEIFRIGSIISKDLNGHHEENVVKFLDDIRRLTWGWALNWESQKIPDRDIMAAFKSQLDVLLSSLE